VVALVLPAGLDPAEAADLAVAFAEAGASLLIVTRLDLARRLGGVVAAAAAARLPLTEAGIGPGAADGLVRLTPAFLATRLMQTGKPANASDSPDRKPAERKPPEHKPPEHKPPERKPDDGRSPERKPPDRKPDERPPYERHIA
jgi:hypothetical protein